VVLVDFRRPDMPGNRVQFDDENWRALYLLARDQMKAFQELADEALKALFKRNDRPVDLKDALRRSAGHSVCIRRFGSPGLERPAPILS
jgi:hypothetical protein